MFAKSLFPKAFAGSLYVLSNSFENYQKACCLSMPSNRDKIRGEYENKIRRMSPPEKIFEVFATEKKDDGKIYMSH